MTFTSSRLVGNRVMVQGTDVLGTHGQTILDSTQWDEVNANQAFDTATEAFEAAVEEFFAPLTEAAEKANQALVKPDDPASYVVLREATTGVRPDAGEVIKLTRDSIVLRLIEQGDTARLVWVNGELEILEAGVHAAATVIPGTAPSGVDGSTGVDVFN